jgi:hypothetical protein
VPTGWFGMQHHDRQGAAAGMQGLVDPRPQGIARQQGGGFVAQRVGIHGLERGDDLSFVLRAVVAAQQAVKVGARACAVQRITLRGLRTRA